MPPAAWCYAVKQDAYDRSRVFSRATFGERELSNERPYFGA